MILKEVKAELEGFHKRFKELRPYLIPGDLKALKQMDKTITCIGAAIHFIDMRIPKPLLYSDEDERGRYGTCPCCGATMYEANFCSECGQAIKIEE